jgi:hypothetical protein
LGSRSFVDNETVTGSDKERNALVRKDEKLLLMICFKIFREELSDELRERFVKEFNRNSITSRSGLFKFPCFQKFIKILKEKN